MRLSLPTVALAAVLAMGCGKNTISSTTGSSSTGGSTTTSGGTTSTSGSTTTTTSSSGSTGGSTTGGTPAFQVAQTARPTYPAEPANGYDISKGRIIQNLAFTGYISATAGTRIDAAATQGFTTFSLQDLRNLPRPSPATGPFKYLLLDLSAGWCPPCNQEAEQFGINGASASKVAYWLSRSGLYATMLVQDYNQQSPSAPTKTDVLHWIGDHNVQSLMGGDVGGALFGSIPQQAFPAQLVINLDTMQIEDAWYGVDDTKIASAWEAVLPPQ
jgi:hypothetical protein